MKKYMLYLAIRVEVKSDLKSQSEIIQAFHERIEGALIKMENICATECAYQLNEIIPPKS